MMMHVKPHFNSSLHFLLRLTVAGLLELVTDALELLHGFHVGSADPLEDALLLVQTLLQRVCLRLDLFF